MHDRGGAMKVHEAIELLEELGYEVHQPRVLTIPLEWGRIFALTSKGGTIEHNDSSPSETLSWTELFKIRDLMEDYKDNED
jgi:hypothetical protein